MPGRNTSRSDLVTNILAFVFAGTCSFFAGYMILRLNGMENPPADMGLRFPPAQKRMITDDAVLVDPMPTGAIAPEEAPMARPGPPRQPYTRNAPVLGQRLLAVIDDLAFVEITRATGKEILPLSRGNDLPGAGTVDWIGRIDGRWELRAGDLRLIAERP